MKRDIGTVVGNIARERDFDVRLGVTLRSLRSRSIAARVSYKGMNPLLFRRMYASRS